MMQLISLLLLYCSVHSSTERDESAGINTARKERCTSAPETKEEEEEEEEAMEIKLEKSTVHQRISERNLSMMLKIEHGPFHLKAKREKNDPQVALLASRPCTFVVSLPSSLANLHLVVLLRLAN
jgi:hypothetical protein